MLTLVITLTDPAPAPFRRACCLQERKPHRGSVLGNCKQLMLPVTQPAPSLAHLCVIVLGGSLLVVWARSDHAVGETLTVTFRCQATLDTKEELAMELLKAEAALLVRMRPTGGGSYSYWPVGCDTACTSPLSATAAIQPAIGDPAPAFGDPAPAIGVPAPATVCLLPLLASLLPLLLIPPPPVTAADATVALPGRRTQYTARLCCATAR